MRDNRPPWLLLNIPTEKTLKRSRERKATERRLVARHWLPPPVSGFQSDGDYKVYLDPDAIRSTTDNRCAGERWLYRADIVIVLWPAAS